MFDFKLHFRGFTFSYGAGTKFKRNTGLCGTSDMNPCFQLATIQKNCPKAIWHFALKNSVHEIKQRWHLLSVSIQLMHMYGISNCSAMFSPNLASLGRMVQEILDKIGENIKKYKSSTLWWHCTSFRAYQHN